jgi:hypothetical protein
MNPDCPVCFGIGWVCENHPDRAWDAELGCTCGAGMPCKCNGGEEPDISQVIIEEKDVTGIRALIRSRVAWSISPEDGGKGFNASARIERCGA